MGSWARGDPGKPWLTCSLPGRLADYRVKAERLGGMTCLYRSEEPPLAEPQQADGAVASPGRLDPRTSSLPEGFEDFYRSSYREVVKAALIAGATLEEAEDAVSKTLTEMLRIWPVPGHPLRYARKAVVHNFIKDKTRGTARVARRLVERGHVMPHDGDEDQRLSAQEGREWTASVLSELTEAQREVMQLIADGLSYEEIADALGKSRDVIRRRLSDARARLVKILNPDGEFRQPQRTTAHSPRQEAP
jgi:RNA polymerase sigma factor (sigma-70 family)